MRASTVNGGVDVTTRNGPVEASTVNGSIDVRMSALRGDGDMRFHTVNGDVSVETPAELDARVSLSTLHGSITTDYPVQLSGRFGPRRASGPERRQHHLQHPARTALIARADCFDRTARSRSLRTRGRASV